MGLLGGHHRIMGDEGRQRIIVLILKWHSAESFKTPCSAPHRPYKSLAWLDLVGLVGRALMPNVV